MQGAPSDIVFELVQIEHKYLVRDNQHLRTEITISLEEALLGFKRVIKHLDDRDIVIEQDGITQPGSTKVVEEEGMPIKNSNQKGNLYVKIHVKIPDYSASDLDELEQFFAKRRNN